MPAVTTHSQTLPLKTVPAIEGSKIETVNYNETLGNSNFISGVLAKDATATPEKLVLSFFNKAKDTYGLKSDAKSLFVNKGNIKDPIGHQVIRMQQVYKGIPVFGYQQIAHVNKKGELLTVSGDVLPENNFQQTAAKVKKITANEAISLAQKDLKLTPKYTEAPKAEVQYYYHDNHLYLTYVVSLKFLDPQPGNWLFFVDVESGKIIHKFNSIDELGTTAKGMGVLGDYKTLQVSKTSNMYYLQDFTRGLGISTYNAKASESLPGTLWRDADGVLYDTYDAPAVDAHYYAGLTYDFYKKMFNRDSYDDTNGPIKSTVHYSTNYNNAFWDGTQMVYGDGDGKTFRSLSGGVDVVAHELTHAVTQYSAGLVYENESGALNESISDIFGTLVEFYNNKNPDWNIGEDVYTPATAGDALRSMYNPTLYGDPDHYSKRYIGDEDNGGVHTNSGIINKAAYLISQGGTQSGVKVTGIGRDKLGKIIYRALTLYLTPVSNFHQMRAAGIQAAKDLYGSTSQEAKTVQDAFSAVGISGVPSTVTALNLGTDYSGTFNNAGEIKWFKIDPSKALTESSHITFSTGDFPSLITVYQDYTRANQGEAYYENVDSTVDFPLSWTGPYYIKVEALQAGDFSLSNTPIYKEPEENSEDCAIEGIAKGSTSIYANLVTMRTIRDQLLDQTDKGEKITSLYYDLSKSIVVDVIKDKKLRSSLTSDLSNLATAMKETEKLSMNGNSSYTITAKDVNALTDLYENVRSDVPQNLKERLDATWKQYNVKQMAGKNLAAVLTQADLLKADNASNEILIKVKKNVSTADLSKLVSRTLSAKGLNVDAKVNALSNGQVSIDKTFKVNVNQNVDEVLKELKKNDLIEYAEKNGTVKASTVDVHYQYQWSLENTGQNDGLAGADINYVDMVKQLSGKSLPAFTIAVVDSGVNYSYADFYGKVLTTLDYDFVNHDDDALDDNSHGSHVAGIIAARSNNKNSIAGINQYARILPVKVLDADGSGTWENVALGIRYAVDKGAKVINLSLSGDEPSNVVEDALRYAAKKGVTVVAAAGNDGNSELSYPASSEYAISVGSTDNIDQLSDYSNYGEGLDVVAPGQRIPSFVANGEVEYFSGTSMSAPHVAAVAGLLYSLKPDITPAQVLQTLQETSEDLGDMGYDDYYGWGRLDAGAAVKYMIAADKVAPAKPTVNPVGDTDKVVTGKAEPYATVYVKAYSKVIGYAMASGTGAYSVTIPAQKVKTTLGVLAKDTVGNLGATTYVVVYDK
ncbi:M4 family metallopeptidase [Neobacillus vireti]|uniref:M4 family metallopeptidase n=1 Tax=Neobacillus vireti TaxID=220686 RepID=UPI003F689F72